MIPEKSVYGAQEIGVAHNLTGIPDSISNSLGHNSAFTSKRTTPQVQPLSVSSEYRYSPQHYSPAVQAPVQPQSMTSTPPSQHCDDVPSPNHTPSIPHHLKRLLNSIGDEVSTNSSPKLPRIDATGATPHSPTSSSSSSTPRYSPQPHSQQQLIQQQQQQQQQHMQTSSLPTFYAYPPHAPPPPHYMVPHPGYAPYPYYPQMPHHMHPGYPMHPHAIPSHPMAAHPMVYPSHPMMPQTPPPQPQQQQLSPRNSTPQASSLSASQITIHNSQHEKVVVLTEELLTMRQAAAAHRLGMSSSALSKRWREAMKNRKWPYRIHCKLEKEIKDLLAQHKGTTKPPDIERKLNMLVEQRRENIEPAAIRL